ncbi:MAG: hypothetical protein M1826_001384 [Phylliscum demangeonii]|nr:MAG: hypothetical protein M1826_001384 [Phylliscum demangeonii]
MAYGLVLSYLTMLVSSTALTYRLAPNEKACFYAGVEHAGVKLAFYYAVQSGGSFDVDYAVHGPHDKVILTGEKERQGDFVFTASEPGEYRFCFNNEMSTFAEKLVDFEIAVENEERATLPSKQGSSPEQTSVLEESIFKLSTQLSTITRNQKYFRTRENRNFSTVRSTERRIFNFSVVESLFMLTMAGLQVFIVRFFFQGARKALTRLTKRSSTFYKMEKITDKIAALPQDAKWLSLEFFPPKTATGASNLRTRLERMAGGLRPLFVTVTWGAGGSTANKSLELAEICQRQLGITTCLHLTCTNMRKSLVDQTLERAKMLGIRNILALRGDPPRNDEYRREMVPPDDEADFVWAIDLVRYIRQCHGNYFCIGVAGYPEGHASESYPQRQSANDDLPYLVEKVKAGADFVLTQLFFDVDAFAAFERLLKNHPSGVFKDVPIIPGLMPIQSYQILKRTTKLSHARLPAELETRLHPVKGDDEAVKEIGVDILCEIVDRVMEGRGAHGREATWDDYPNGRFGDARSPAYGEIDGYGVNLHMPISQALKLWGHPSTTADVTGLFTRHIDGSLEAIPWSEEGLNEESAAIRPELLALNRRGWWTVASQPAVNGVSSDDKTFGWGPKNGLVFQKAFVEFFLPASEWERLRARLSSAQSLAYYAGNSRGDFVCSDRDAVNAVTWGVFPGKETITPTIIEQVSFRAWLDEAFALWREWQQMYAPESASAALLGRIRDGYWLVSVIHHAYADPGALWELLLLP